MTLPAATKVVGNSGHTTDHNLIAARLALTSEVHNVVDKYGALGDDSTNDSAAVAAAITGANGAAVYFPGNKTYKLGTQVSIPNAATTLIFGDGATIHFTGTGAAFSHTNHNATLTVRGGKFTGGMAFDITMATSGTEYRDFDIADCTFEQSAATYSINLNGAREGFITRCTFNSGAGIYRTLTVNTFIAQCYWKNTDYMVFDDGAGSPYSAGLHLVNCVGIGCTVGLKIKYADWFSVTNCMIDYCDSPIIIEGQDGGSFTGSYISSRTNAVVQILTGTASTDHVTFENTQIIQHDTGNADCVVMSNARYTVFNGCGITFWDRYGIDMTSCTFTQIIGCDISYNSSGTAPVRSTTDDSSNMMLGGHVTGTPSYTFMKFRDVSGYATRARGTATCLSGNTDLVVTHGLAKAPSVVLITPARVEANGWRVTSLGATTFTVQFGVQVAADTVVYWQAECDST